MAMSLKDIVGYIDRYNERLNRLRESLSSYEGKTREILDGVTRRVYDSNNPDLVLAYNTLVENLEGSVGRDELLGRLNVANEQFVSKRLKAEKASNALSYREALEFWKKRDSEQKLPVHSDGVYRLRIRLGASEGHIKVKKKNRRIIGIDRNSFFGYISDYGEGEEGRAGIIEEIKRAMGRSKSRTKLREVIRNLGISEKSGQGYYVAYVHHHM